MTAPRQEADLEDAEVQTEEGGDALQELLEARMESVRTDWWSYDAWTSRQLRGELAARKIEARGLRTKSTFVDRLRQDDRENLAREQAECEDCQRVERAFVERHRPETRDRFFYSAAFEF